MFDHWSELPLIFSQIRTNHQKFDWTNIPVNFAFLDNVFFVYYIGQTFLSFELFDLPVAAGWLTDFDDNKITRKPCMAKHRALPHKTIIYLNGYSLRFYKDFKVIKKYLMKVTDKRLSCKCSHTRIQLTLKIRAWDRTSIKTTHISSNHLVRVYLHGNLKTFWTLRLTHGEKCQLGTGW